MFQTPLFIAGEKGHIDIMKALLKHDKIDINKQVPFFFFHFFPTIAFLTLFCLKQDV